MMKDQILDILRKDLTEEIKKLEAIATHSHAAATNAELKAENKYDTQGIEAGYLAGAHFKRLASLREDFARLGAFRPTGGDSKKVTLGSIVTLKSEHGSEDYFISPVVGRASVIVSGATIKVISNVSPLGQELMGLERGESFEIETALGSADYEVVEIR